MKLWQKVFLCTLSLTVLAVLVTSQVVIQLDFSATVARENQRSASEHSFFSGGISSRVAYETAQQGEIFLGEEEIQSLLAEFAAGQVGSATGLAVYLNGGRIASGNTPFELREEDILQSIQGSSLQEDEIRTVIRNRNGEYYIVCASALSLENRAYELFTLRNVSQIYRERDNQAQRAQVILLSFSGAIGIVLFLLLRSWLSPLGRVNATIQEIARGNYGLRVRETGSREFRELSRSVNIMAAAVEGNVERIQSLADGRKEFIDNLAHEMKTPLTSILGFGDLLRIKRTVSDKQRRDFSGVIVEEAKRLQSLSGKLMELAVAQEVQPDYQALNVEELFEEVGLAVAPLLARRNIRLTCESSGEIFSGDRELVKSLLYNLVDNASKASKEGDEVLLSCSTLQNKVLISVSDWGMGMSEKTVKKATEAFYMEDKSRSRKSGGAGLGLALCAQIAQVHKATLHIKSELGKGTTIFVAFPGEQGAREVQNEGEK